MNNFYKGGRGMACGHSAKVTELRSNQTCQYPPKQNILNSLWLIANGLLRMAYSLKFKIKCLKPIAYGLLLLFVSMFSLSDAWAQSAETWAAERQTEIKPLLTAQRVPEEFWIRKHLFYIDGDTVSKDLSAYKDKMLVLGFWATWCSSCLKNGPMIEAIVNKNPEKLAYVKINSVRTKDNIAKIDNLLNGPIGRSYKLRADDFSSIVEDTYLQELFPNHGYPLYVWIYKGVIQLMTYQNLFNYNLYMRFVGGE